MKRSRPLRRKVSMKARKPMRRVGKVGQRGIVERRAAREEYVSKFGRHIVLYSDRVEREATCQSCGRVVLFKDSCFSHKIPRGRKPGNEPHRGIYSCWLCNTFADLKKEYRDALIASKADMTNGLTVEWTEKQRQELNTYIQKYEGLW